MTSLQLILIISGIIFQAEETHELIIEVTQIEEPTGSLKIALFNNKAEHLKSSVHSGIFKVTSRGTLQCAFKIPYGEYSFTLYHDEDADGELNTNFMGIPSEPYAFSNNASILFGPPSYDKCKFSFAKSGQVMKVKLK